MPGASRTGPTLIPTQPCVPRRKLRASQRSCAPEELRNTNLRQLISFSDTYLPFQTSMPKESEEHFFLKLLLPGAKGRELTRGAGLADCGVTTGSIGSAADQAPPISLQRVWTGVQPSPTGYYLTETLILSQPHRGKWTHSSKERQTFEKHNHFQKGKQMLDCRFHHKQKFS